MFDIQSIPMIVEPAEGVTRVTVKPVDLYPAMIARIREVLEGAIPSELLATRDRGGTARAEVLVRNAQGLPEAAWDDALLPRSDFVNIPYFSFVQSNGGTRPEMMAALNETLRPQVERMIARGFALEIAMGWFCQAIRLKFGAYDLTIEKNDEYRL